MQFPKIIPDKTKAYSDSITELYPKELNEFKTYHQSLIGFASICLNPASSASELLKAEDDNQTA